MRLLVAIMTCHRYAYDPNDFCLRKGLRSLDQSARVNTIRDTWVRAIPAEVEYKFFYGRGQGLPLADEVFLDCGDSYNDNPAKMKAICRYAIDHGFDYVLRTDDDTFIYPVEILATNWAEFDYSGSGQKPFHEFHPGGLLFLSRRFMEIICAGRPDTYADDLWIGKLAKKNHIPLNYLPNTRNQFGSDYRVPADVDPTGIASFHSCTPETMRRLWEHPYNSKHVETQKDV